MRIFIVSTVFAVDAAIRVRLGFGVFTGGIEGGAGEVKAYGAPLIIDDLGLQAGENAQGLCVAFKAAAFGSVVIKRIFAIVAIGWMTNIVGKPGHLTQVGMKSQPLANAAGDLGDFQRVREPGAWGIAIVGADDLSLIGQPAQCRRVQHAGAVTGKGTALIGF